VAAEAVCARVSQRHRRVCQHRDRRREHSGVGVREIAEAAGVDAALVNRYFGTKDGLFAEAVTEAHGRRLPEVLDGPPEDLGRRLAEYVLAPEKGVGGADPLLALVRSTPHPVATELLRRGVDEGLVAPIAARLAGPDARVRARLVAATMLGLAVGRGIARSDELDPQAHPELVAGAAAALQRLVTPPGA